MPIPTWSPDDEKPDPRERIPRIAGMGYRLAAAGPRTRQRLIEREAGFPPPDDIRYSIPLAAVLPKTDTPWPAPLDDDTNVPLARLSSPRRGFPVWRSLALVASAACGFSLVIFGQTLHMDRKFAAATSARPAPLGAAQEEIALETSRLADAATETQTADLDSALPTVSVAPAAPPRLRPALADAVEPQATPLSTSAAALPAAQQPSTMSPAASPTATHPATHLSPRLYASSVPAMHHASLADTRPAPGRAEPRHLAATRPSAHYDLPSWLTHPRPEPQAAPPNERIMSPPPQTLDEQLAARTGRTTPDQTETPDPAPVPAPPQRGLPPIPAPHGPPIIYAEAQYPQPRPHLPPPTPYQPPYAGYGYYAPPVPYGDRPPPYAW